MPVTAFFFKLLKIILEYGMLFWFLWFLLRLTRNLFRDFNQQSQLIQGKKVLPREAALVVVEAQENSLMGKRYTFSEQISIGRGQENDIIIPESFVSHHHTVIYAHGGQFVVEDLGSRNHTFVNNRPLTGKVFLHAGDLIRIGMVTLRFER